MSARLHLVLKIEDGYDGEYMLDGIVEALNTSAREGLIVELRLSDDALSEGDDLTEVPTFVEKVGIERTLD